MTGPLPIGRARQVEPVLETSNRHLKGDWALGDFAAVRWGLHGNLHAIRLRLHIHVHLAVFLRGDARRLVPSWPASGPPSRLGDVHLASHEGYHVATWLEPGLVHALVGGLPEATLAKLARLCMAKMTAFLDELRPQLAGRGPS